MRCMATCPVCGYETRNESGFHAACLKRDRSYLLTDEELREMGKDRSSRGTGLKAKFGGIKVKCVETGEVFKSIQAAAAASGATRTMVSKAVANSERIAGGFHWEAV